MSSVPSLPGSPGFSLWSSRQCPEHSLLLMISCPFLSVSAISCLLIFSLLHFSRTPFKGQDGPWVTVGAVRVLDWWIPLLCSLSFSVILFPARRGQMRIPLLSLPWTLPCLLMTVVCGLSHSEAWEKGMLLREAQGLNLCALCSFRFLWGHSLGTRRSSPDSCSSLGREGGGAAFCTIRPLTNWTVCGASVETLYFLLYPMYQASSFPLLETVFFCCSKELLCSMIYFFLSSGRAELWF